MTNYSKINVDGVESLIKDLTKDGGENVKAAVLIDEVNANVGKKIEEADKKLTTTQEQMSATQQRIKNVPPGSAAHTALSAQLKQLEANAGEYRNQIGARSQMVEQLFAQAQQAGDPEGWAKRQAAAKAAANPPPAAPAQPEVPKWKRGMTAAEEAELKSYREYEAAQKRRAEEKKEQDKVAAAKATEDQLKAKAQKITPDVIKTMTKDEVLGLVNNDTYRYLDRKQKDALVMRNLEIRAGR